MDMKYATRRFRRDADTSPILKMTDGNRDVYLLAGCAIHL